MNAKLWLDILNQDFDVTGYDLVALQKMLLSTSEIVTFDNAVCKYLGLTRNLQRSIDSVTAISRWCCYFGLTDRYQLPLKVLQISTLEKILVLC
jgi:hypothetical protein